MNNDLFLELLKQKFKVEDYTFPPIFSFEGLPGAGKTTQIIKASQGLEKRFGKAYYIDLPTTSEAGIILRALYKDLDKWDEVRFTNPWLNPLLLSIDLKIALSRAKSEGAKYVLMSRGILSTYYYNLDTYLKKYKEMDEAWAKLTEDLNDFEWPKALIYFDVSPEVAHERVVKRNRGPLRKMDQIEQMEKDQALLQDYLTRFNGKFPVHTIDGSASQEEVTESIAKVLENYLEHQNV